MYRLVPFTVALFLAGVHTADDFQKCMKLIDSEAKNSSCCKQDPVKKELKDMDIKELDTDFYEKYKECDDLSFEGKECSEKSVCIAKKAGVMKDNGDIDKEAMANIMKDKVEAMLSPEAYKRMNTCLDDDLAKYEKDASCDMEKMGNCMQLSYIVSCMEWSDEKSCSEMKNTADECAKMFS